MVLAIDLFCGLGGWAEGFLAEGYDVVGFDIERHDYGTGGYPGQLVIQDVLTLDGSQFKDAAVIVASPPCQAYSYRAMPWKRAKALPPPDNTLFDACFRIQREACEAAGRHIPLIVENVKGAQKWVGRAAWHFGSFYLWGDVPALMPMTALRNWKSNEGTHKRIVGPGRPRFISETKNNGGSWFAVAPHNRERGQNPDGRKIHASCSERRWEDREVKRLRDAGNGSKGGGDWFGCDENMSLPRSYASRSPKRKMASAMIAKIPFPLAQHLARSFRPLNGEG